MARDHHTSSPEQTEALAAELAAALVPGDVVLVEGELGAGKTTFVRGACRALGVDGVVTSPTFTIGQRYPGAVPVSHLDLYRVGDLEDEDPDLLADYIGPDRIAFVEWPGGAIEAIAGLSRLAARVVIEHGGGDRRVVRIGAPAGAKAPPSGAADPVSKAPPSGAADPVSKAPPSGAADPVSKAPPSGAADLFNVPRLSPLELP